MAEKNNTSNVEITVGDCNIEINGSEEFISNQLTTILDRVDLSGHVEQPGVEKRIQNQKQIPQKNLKPWHLTPRRVKKSSTPRLKRR